MIDAEPRSGEESVGADEPVPPRDAPVDKIWPDRPRPKGRGNALETVVEPGQGNTSWSFRPLGIRPYCVVRPPASRMRLISSSVFLGSA
jgi:hypothetical protein